MDRRTLGNIAEARAIYVLTEEGYTISIPHSENNPYDLVIEKDGCFSSVQVKGTQNVRGSGSYEVDLRTSKFNTKGQNRTKMVDKKFDFLAVMTPDSFYLIPSEEINTDRSVSVSPSNGYSEYKIR